MEPASPQHTKTASVEMVGRYEIAGRIALGGMAELFLGRLAGPGGFERPVVVKRILPHLAETESFVQMFLDEARIAARITHANVVQVHELGRHEGDLFLVMEYLEGESLMTLLRRLTVRRLQLAPALVAAIGVGAAAGLHAAHEVKDDEGHVVGLVHRDVSPHNIFVTYDGHVKVIDFGIAKAANQMNKTATGQLKGKFAFMSPEQAEGKGLDRRSDIFSLGIVLWEAAAGRRLFKRNTPMETLRAVTRAEIIPLRAVVPDFPGELERIIHRCLSADPGDRFASASELQRELTRFFHAHHDELPNKAIAAQMEGLFADRRLEKRLMLQRLRDGSELTSVPMGDLDENVDLPLASEELAIPTTIDGPPPKSSNRTVLAALVSLVLGAAAVVVWSQSRQTNAGIQVTPLINMPASEGLRGANAEQEPAATAETSPEPEEAPSTVAASFVSEPAGATVWRGEHALGETPLELELERGDDPVEFELRLEGHEDVTVRLARPLLSQPERAAGAGDTDAATHARAKNASESDGDHALRGVLAAELWLRLCRDRGREALVEAGPQRYPRSYAFDFGNTQRTLSCR